MTNALKDKKLFLLDMDGTIYLEDDLFDGTLDFLAHVQRIGGRAMYLTNNSSKSVSSYVDKLKRLGIEAKPEDFFTSVNATVLHLQKQSFHKIYAFGTNSFKQQLREGGLAVTDRLEEDIDCLCMGFDTELTFQKLEDACILLNRGVEYIATNPKRGIFLQEKNNSTDSPESFLDSVDALADLITELWHALDMPAMPEMRVASDIVERSYGSFRLSA